jgi:hypothetical protein
VLIRNYFVTLQFALDEPLFNAKLGGVMAGLGLQFR